MLEGGGRLAIVNLPVTPLESPVDGGRAPKTRRQERKDCSDQSIVFENSIAIVIVVVVAAAGGGSQHESGLFGGACGRMLIMCGRLEEKRFLCQQKSAGQT
jgi:hypothetical protein